MKRFKILVGMTLTAVSCLLTTPKVVAEEAYDIQYSYVEESSLTEEEKAMIRTGAVNERVQRDAEIRLVYRKKAVCEQPEDPTLENSNQTPGKIEGQAKVKAVSKRQNPPKTGDAFSLSVALALWVCSGVVIVLVAGKKRRAAGGLVLAIALTSLQGETIFAENRVLAELPGEKKTVQSGSQVTYQPEQIRCYDYVGYLIQREQPGKIIARYFLGKPENPAQLLLEKVLREGEVGSPTGGREQVEKEAREYLNHMDMTAVAAPLSPEEKAELISSYKKVAEEAVRLAEEVRPNKGFYLGYDMFYRRMVEHAQNIEEEMNQREYYRVKDFFPKDPITGRIDNAVPYPFFNGTQFLDSEGNILSQLDIQPDSAGNSTLIRRVAAGEQTNRRYVEKLAHWQVFPYYDPGIRSSTFILKTVNGVECSREVRENLEEGVTYIDFYIGSVKEAIISIEIPEHE